MSRRAHQPDPAQRRQVETMAAYGIPEGDISRVMGIDPKTLRKHYHDELDLGETKANAQVAGFLFNAARNGNVTAQIFWLKTRARWKETPSEHWHTGAVGTFDISQLTDAALARIVGATSETVPPSKRAHPRIELQAAPEPVAAEKNRTLPRDQ